MAHISITSIKLLQFLVVDNGDVCEWGTNLQIIIK